MFVVEKLEIGPGNSVLYINYIQKLSQKESSTGIYTISPLPFASFAFLAPLREIFTEPVILKTTYNKALSAVC